MKNLTLYHLPNARPLLAGLLLCAILGHRVQATGTEPALAARIHGASVLYQPLAWVGTTPPAEAENQALWGAIQQIQLHGVAAGRPALEQFLDAFPSSPWAPSLHANLGRYHYEQGAFSEALREWQTAWTATRQEKGGPGKQIADFTIVYWTRLLAGLGEADTLGSLLEETQGRRLDGGPLQQMLNRNRQAHQRMVAHTEVVFRCGVYALADVGHALRGSAFDFDKLRRAPAPVTGFSLAALTTLAQQAGLELVAAEWGQSKSLPVPCVVHWKQKHYAAILAEKNGLYQVVDAIFVKPRWLKPAVIQAEASGYFLVPRDRLPQDWRPLASAQAEQVYGRGPVESATDDDDGCGNGSGGGGASGGGFGGILAAGGFGISTAVGGDAASGGNGGTAAWGPLSANSSRAAGSSGTPVSCGTCGNSGGGGSAGSTGGSGASCPICPGANSSSGGGGTLALPRAAAPAAPGGMPVWEVSEPYITLWLYDECLGYQPGLGSRVSFKLAYKQRESALPSPNFFSLGKMWNCGWLSYITDDSPGSSATMRVPGGGVRTYTPDNSTMEYYSHTLLQRKDDGQGGLAGFVVSYADGSKDYYSDVPANGLLMNGVQVAFLTAKVDAFGHTNRFTYEQVFLDQQQLWTFRLKSVIDADGRSTSVLYDNVNYPAQITQVQDPFGRSALLQYDDDGMLTNAIDVASLTNSFQYDYQGWITSLTTPYGPTSFEHTDNGAGPNLGSVNVLRALRVIDAAGGTNVYLLQQDSQSAYDPAAPRHRTPFLPWSYNDPSIVPQLGSVPLSLYDGWMNFRNSFHWSPSQAAGVPANLDLIDLPTFRKARRLHWFHPDLYGNVVGQTIEMAQDPSPNGVTPGQTTWYDYDGSSDWWDGRTESQPAIIARVLPDGTTWYQWFQRDQWGRATNVVQTWSTAYGAAPLTRTNQYVYDLNGIDLDQVIGPNGETLAGYAYDAHHQFLRATNAVGDVTFYTYDDQGRLTSTKTPAGLTTTNIYFSTGDYTNFIQTTIDLQIGRTNSFTYLNDLVSTRTDERGLTTTYTADNLGRLTSLSDPRGVITYTYDKLDLVQVVDRLGFTNSYGYDPLRRLTAHTNALGFFTLYNYCPCGSLDSIRDAAGNYTSFTYDNAGRLIQTGYPDNYLAIRNYNLLGQLTNSTDSSGYSVTNWFNNQGLLYAVSNAFGQVKALAFDIKDRLLGSTDANGVTTTMTYDALDRMLTRSYPDGGVEKFGYAARGLIAYTNQLGLTNFYAYDAARRKTAETNANREVTQFYYDSSGNLTDLTDAKNHHTFWNYDQYGRVTNKVDDASHVLFVYQYDADNRLIARTSAAKGTTTYRYDPIGNLTNIVYPVSSNISMAYDPLNRLTKMVDAAGTTRYAYDAVGQLLSEDGPWIDDTVSYTYANRLRASMSVVAPNGSWAQSYGYDAADRLSTITSPAGSFTYGYTGVVASASGSLLWTLSLPGGACITNLYDAVARQKSAWLVNSTKDIIDGYGYTYNSAGQRTQLGRRTLSGGATFMTYAYDPAGQLVKAVGSELHGSGMHLFNVSRLQEQFGYTYDAAGNLIWRTNNALVEGFNVNSLNELATATNTGTLTVAGTTSSQATNVSVNGSAAALYLDSTFAAPGFTVANGLNAFTAVARDAHGRRDTNSVTVNLPATVTYSYDLNGNLLSDGNRYFDYDDENQLTSVTVPNAWRSEFVYDGKMRRRIRREYNWTSGSWVLASEVHYIYDGNLVIQERNGLNLPQVSYTRGRDLSGGLQGAGGIGGLLARTDHGLLAVGDSGAHAYYHADANGNITALINAKQVIVAQYVYDPYGNLIGQSGALADANLYRFSSKEFHPNSGLVYYLYRFYDPNLQRWLNRDPLGDSEREGLFLSASIGSRLHAHFAVGPLEQFGEQNLQEFVMNDPVGKTDALGLSFCDWLATKMVQEAFRDGRLHNPTYAQALYILWLQLCSSPPRSPLAGDGPRCKVFDPSLNTTILGVEVGAGGVIIIIIILAPVGV